MIDLSKNKKDLYPIKLEDGTILKLKKPTQSMYIQMVQLEDSKGEGVQMIEEIFSILVRIFNRNDQGIVFTLNEIEEMVDIETAMLIIEDYLRATSLEVGK